MRAYSSDTRPDATARTASGRVPLRRYSGAALARRKAWGRQWGAILSGIAAERRAKEQQ